MPRAQRRVLVLVLALVSALVLYEVLRRASHPPRIAALPPRSDAGPLSPDELVSSADALFTEATEAGKFSGTVVVVDLGKTVLTKGYGQADREHRRPNDAETIFRIASLSKQFTASAILALAADGKLAVHDPLAKYIPEYPRENLVKDGVEVTLHHLLSHTSGLPDGRKTTYFTSNVWKRPIDRDALLAEAKSRPLVRVPGTSFAYLNFGYFLLGLVVERVSGETYESFLRRRFFDPLAMTSTGTVLGEDKAPRAARGYRKSLLRGMRTMADDPDFGDRDVSFAFGSGQIYATVGDLVRWDRALAGGTIAGQKELFAPNLSHYGYGWSVENAGGVDYQWHNGTLSPLGFSSYLIRVPSKQRMIAWLSNYDSDLTEELELQVEALALR